MKILITGGLGHIGSYVIRNLNLPNTKITFTFMTILFRKDIVQYLISKTIIPINLIFQIYLN